MWILFLQAIIMGIVEGITEFIPVSSTGHLIIIGHFIKFEAPYISKGYVDMFEVVIQLGAILAVVVLYWSKIWKSIKEFFTGKKSGIIFWVNIIIGTIPAVIIGFLFDDTIKKYLFNPLTVSAALVVGGVLMIIIENKFRHKCRTKKVEDITPMQALKIGVFQCLAILWPGMSRSASTIMGSWIVGVSSVAAAEFSFFLAIPAMIGASGLSLLKIKVHMTQAEIIALIAAFLIAFLVAYLVMEKFIKFLQRKPMRIFALYRILVGVILLGLFAAKLIK